MELEVRRKLKESEAEEEPTEDALFERIMEGVGMRGPFQRRFNLMFNLLFILLMAMPYFNIVLAMTVPEHWCHVPGRNLTNMTAAEWKDRTIPTKDTIQEFHNCKMYNTTWSLTRNMTAILEKEELTLQEIGCQHGWEYDDSWYSLTAATQEDWVCDRELYVTNTFVATRIGEVVGTFVFGQLGDTLGRKPVFYIGLVMLVIGRIVSAFSAESYYVFLVAAFIGSMPASPLFQSPLILAIEVSPGDQRSQITMLHSIGWTAGMCLMPMVAWATGHWVVFLLLTSLPSALFIFSYGIFPESPRWLASRGKIERCLRSLRHIAKMNGTTLPDNTVSILKRIAEGKESMYGLASLFSSWRLAKNTLLISFCWVIGALIYFTLLLNITNMSGNPFLNFFFQSLVELPGYVCGKYFSEKIGRRWTQSGALLVATLSQIIVLFIVTAPHLDWLLNTVVVFVKFVVTTSFYASYLIAMETYPTCVRQTGTSMTSVAASAVGVLGPYIVYLGTVWDPRWPYIIMGSLTLLSAIAASFLPETLNQKLPETLKDAQFFGQYQKFWSMPAPPLQTAKKDEEMRVKE